MEQHTQIKSRQVSGSCPADEGSVPALEKTPSCEATFYGGVNRGIKFDDPGKDCTKEGPMEEEHTSRTR